MLAYIGFGTKSKSALGVRNRTGFRTGFSNEWLLTWKCPVYLSITTKINIMAPKLPNGDQITQTPAIKRFKVDAYTPPRSPVIRLFACTQLTSEMCFLKKHKRGNPTCHITWMLFFLHWPLLLNFRNTSRRTRKVQNHQWWPIYLECVQESKWVCRTYQNQTSMVADSKPKIATFCTV